MRRYQIVLFFLSFFVLSSSEAESFKSEDINIHPHRSISLHDGTQLSLTIWRPNAPSAQPLPTVLVMTPYISDETHLRAMKFARQGYAYVSVDRRGRGHSEGRFRPLQGNGPDGADVIAWVREQPWSDGRVVMRGGSYRGMAQWQVMAEHPPGLVATIPTAAVYPGHDFPHADGIYYSYIAQWLSLTSGRTGNDQLFGDIDFWQSQFLRLHRQNRPFHELSRLAGTNADIFLEWLDHPDYDDFWRDHNPRPEDYQRMDLPILTITGYFDGDQPGALRYYEEFMRHADSEAQGRHFLLIGPWEHAGTRYPTAEIGGLRFDDKSVLDLDQLQIDWFDWILKGEERPALLRDRVTYYVMGEETWHHASELANLADEELRFYLSAPLGAGDVFHSGHLQTQLPGDETAQILRHNPLDKLDEAPDSESYFTDTSDAMKSGILVYHSAPLDRATTLAGVMKLDLHLSLDVPDADLSATVGAILPDGSFLWLGQDVLRARYRHGREKAVPVIPGQIELYRFDGFYLTARQLPEGSRLRLILAPFNSPNFQKNFQSGGRIGYESAVDAQTASINVYHNDDYPSVLRLPIAHLPVADDGQHQTSGSNRNHR